MHTDEEHWLTTFVSPQEGKIREVRMRKWQLKPYRVVPLISTELFYMFITLISFYFITYLSPFVLRLMLIMVGYCGSEEWQCKCWLLFLWEININFSCIIPSSIAYKHIFLSPMDTGPVSDTVYFIEEKGVKAIWSDCPLWKMLNGAEKTNVIVHVIIQFPVSVWR